MVLYNWLKRVIVGKKTTELHEMSGHVYKFYFTECYYLGNFS